MAAGHRGTSPQELGVTKARRIGQDRGAGFPPQGKTMPSRDFRIQRLFIDADLAANGEIALSREQANYVRIVLRLPAGAEILLFNGRDGEWRGRLKDAGRRAVHVTVEVQTRAQTSPGTLAYAFAPLKHARLDYMVQKAVEMGVAQLTPVMTRHTQVTRVNVERMRANMIEAAEQCGILSLPAVHEPIAFDRWIATLGADRVVVFCDEEAEMGDPLEALKRARPGPAVLLIGPEGGFEESERRALLARDRVIRLSLGPRVLRADTAAVAALALVQAIIGDWQ
jgi:16S rRNA (uracil1498-N3)-methyltransferase